MKIEPYKGIADIYDEIRPSYPEKLIQDIIIKTNLKIEDKILEIGPGTGKATIQFARKGFTIHGIELGEDMAEIFKRKCASYPNVSIEVEDFEKWNSNTKGEYDVIFSAQAFHWLDTNIKYKKCHEILKDNGYLVLFWYKPCDNLPETKEIDEKVDRIVKKYTSKNYLDKEKPQRKEHNGPLNDDEKKAEIISSGLFELVEKIEYTQEKRNNASEYLKAIKSVPSFASKLDYLDDKTIENIDNEISKIIDNYGGYVSTMFNFSLYITKKIKIVTK